MPRTALTPGSFDPPTVGHLDVIERASRLFDRLYVSVGVNPSKSGLLTVEERVQALRASVAHLPSVQVDSFAGLLVEHAVSLGATTVVRGLRATADFEYEFQMAMINNHLHQEIETVFLMTRWEYSYLSSSIVRELANLGGDFREMVPPPVVPIIEKALARRAQ